MSAASLATLDGSLRMTLVEQPRPPALADLGSRLMIVVERREDWASYLPSEEVLTAQEYLEQSARDHGGRRVQVINLCRGYKYLGLGYYCSLLAEARGHRVIPSLRCISELARKSVYGLALGGLDKALDKALCRTPYGATDGFTLTLYFG
ncbi:RimK-like ATPgrasp N-terminal domain-containing protein, partial [Pseudomonas aeruginosa]